MNDDFKVDKQVIVVMMICAFIIVLGYCCNLDSYVQRVTLPFTVILFGYTFLFINRIKNKKALFLLIPIVLILLSSLVTSLDMSNAWLNVVVLLLLFSMYFFLWMNPNYHVSGNFWKWICYLFPTSLFSNFHYVKIGKCSEKTFEIIRGIIIGGLIGIVLLFLLMSADSYFSAFISQITNLFQLDFDHIVLWIVYFLVLFNSFIRILENQDREMDETEYLNLNTVTVTTVLAIINLVFALFLFSEFSKLTVNFLKLPVEYTYAQYAREGFFQLLAVTTINFSIIMFLFYKSHIIKENKVKRLILLLITFSIILIFNSYYRMFLYIGRFGFTVLRLQVILFLAMEFFLFLLMIWKVIKGLKNKDAILYFIVMISFYIVNLYLCHDEFIQLLNSIH